MEPIEFTQQTTVIAKDQPEYLPLPSEIKKDGTVISCWKFTFRERLNILFGKNLFLSVSTFNQKLQPQRPSVGYPEETFTFWDSIDENGNKVNERIVKKNKLSDKEKESLKQNGIDYE